MNQIKRLRYIPIHSVFIVMLFTCEDAHACLAVLLAGSLLSHFFNNLSKTCWQINNGRFVSFHLYYGHEIVSIVFWLVIMIYNMAHSIIFPKFLCSVLYSIVAYNTNKNNWDNVSSFMRWSFSFHVVGEGVRFGIQVSFVAILIIAAPSIITKPWLGHVASFHRERMQWELGCLCAKSL